ncbi:MAG: ArsR/SmtB family transcription factor [Anaerolineae bacterium]
MMDDQQTPFQAALDEPVAAQVAELFSALSDTSRIRIIAALVDGEMNVSALAAIVGISASLVKRAATSPTVTGTRRFPLPGWMRPTPPPD